MLMLRSLVSLRLDSRKGADVLKQDGSGWTPLMIASSLKESEELVDLLLRKEADVNAISKLTSIRYH